MTTDNDQLELIAPAIEIEHYERAVELMLRRLTTWTRLPDERTDWDLEQLLQELGTACQALRRLRGEADLPF